MPRVSVGTCLFLHMFLLQTAGKADVYDWLVDSDEEGDTRTKGHVKPRTKGMENKPPKVTSKANGKAKQAPRQKVRKP